jgi:N6-adenosine-specific RNA methylase IME4
MRPFAYGLIVADPPWDFVTYSDRGQKKGPASQYSVMSMDEIKALPVGHLAGGDCLLWLWATNPMIDQQIEVCRAWGFRFVTCGVWIKRTKTGKLNFGTGYRLRCSSEPFIIATNGNPPTARDVRTVIEGPIRGHSRKPDEAYAIAEHLAGNVLRADLFSRETRPGWDAWGNESGKFDDKSTAGGDSLVIV